MSEHYPAGGAPDELYRRRREAHARELDRLEGRSAWLGRGRLASFLAAVVCAVVAVAWTQTPRPAWLAVAGASAVLFGAFVAADSRLGRRLRREAALARVYERALARKARDWQALDALEVPRGVAAGPTVGDGSEADRAAPAFVRDLHLFGHASLFRLLATPGTPAGRRALARWLAGPSGAAALPEEVRLRQEAVRALAGELDWRAGLEARAWGPGDDRGRDPAAGRRGARPGQGLEEPHLDRFYEWLAEEPWLLRRPLVLWSARALTVAAPAALLAWLLGPLPWSAALLVVFAAYALSASFDKRLARDFERATAGADGLRGHGEVFRWLEELPGEGRRLDGLRERLTTEGRSAASWMDRLERLMVLADLRFGLMHFFVEVLFQWDFHLQARFERWREVAGPSARGWLEALGEVEALAALGALAHAQPEWAFPEVDPEADAVAGRSLGHPLIPDGRRVGNDITVGPPGTFLLVTGSNMSGKSTLLRSIGTNAVLAWAGGPVCAAGLRLPPVVLATSIAVEDSLEEGVSFFLAELLRLKAVVVAAEAAPPGARVVYLLDEVLRGTNSLERRIAVQRVIGRLVALGAIGAVTTHDLEILAEGELADEARPIHFRETVRPRPEGGAEMTFDYAARPGLATTTNALRLLEAVGLAGDEPS
ncbi:MAG TPA: hypothetical protein VF150_09715 [Thermoanaerobaculia bacterium]